MKEPRLILACLLVSLSGLLVSPLRAATPTANTGGQRHCLWKVQGGKSVVYLLGSVHALKEKDYPLATVIESAFTNAQVAAFETDVEALSSPMVALKLMGKSRLPPGETLQDQLSPEVYSSFTNRLNSAGLSEISFRQLKPMMAVMTLVLLEMQRLDLDPKFGVDKHFHERAVADGKKVVPLETVDFQISLLTEMSREEGELLMKTTLRDLDKMGRELGELLKAWHTGDADKLDRILNEAKQDSPVIFKRLLTDRNQNWLPKIEEMLQGDQTAIVIVGAGHLVGKEGVVELLKKKGFKVTQE